MSTAVFHADPGQVAARREVTLLELLDRILDRGIVLSGDITLAVADVDLVHLSLRALISSVETTRRPPGDPA